MSSTTMVAQVSEQPVHRIKVSAVDDGASFAPRLHQPRMAQVREVKREIRRRNTQRGAEGAGRKTVGTRTDQGTEDPEPGLMREPGERGHRESFLHS